MALGSIDEVDAFLVGSEQDDGRAHIQKSPPLIQRWHSLALGYEHADESHFEGFEAKPRRLRSKTCFSVKNDRTNLEAYITPSRANISMDETRNVLAAFGSPGKCKTDRLR